MRAGLARAGFSLFLAYLLLAQSVLCLGLSTQHALAGAGDPGSLFCHADAATPDGAGLALAAPANAPAPPEHDAGPAMAPCAICAFASADYTPPAEWGVVPLSRTFVRLHRPPLHPPQVLALARVTPRLSQGPPSPV